mmetsp:Transcript_90886/g.161791  ORF Transcript_90886/g.161791 Transcript_90886/m.161791 type:complete len:160 (-) Transcript_90886:943-1422(-)
MCTARLHQPHYVTHLPDRLSDLPVATVMRELFNFVCKVQGYEQGSQGQAQQQPGRAREAMGQGQRQETTKNLHEDLDLPTNQGESLKLAWALVQESLASCSKYHDGKAVAKEWTSSLLAEFCLAEFGLQHKKASCSHHHHTCHGDRHKAQPQRGSPSTL